MNRELGVRERKGWKWGRTPEKLYGAGMRSVSISLAVYLRGDASIERKLRDSPGTVWME